MNTTTYLPDIYPLMSPSSRSIMGVSLDLTAVTPQQSLAFAAAIAMWSLLCAAPLILLGWCFAHCSRAQRHDLTSLVETVVRGLGRREP
jgi:hypothetical protein